MTGYVAVMLGLSLADRLDDHNVLTGAARTPGEAPRLATGAISAPFEPALTFEPSLGTRVNRVPTVRTLSMPAAHRSASSTRLSHD